MRALAVLPVILHHANFDWISGGYVGVDVFFVISGYLIASIIFSEKAAGNFSLVKFYERRARRILPALFLVVLACIPPALMWMTKIQLEEFFESVAAVALFASNFLFWEQAGYFGVAAETKPLLHTWSLAVEEQFYMLFPLLVIVLWKLPRRFFATALGVLALASLALSHYTSSVAPSANFYWSPTRIWELLVGVLLATAERNGPLHPRVAAGLSGSLAFLGLAAVIASFFAFDRSTPFPGLYAVLPVVGTVLILAFGRETTLVGRILGTPPLVGIGLISYSAYLWHQPLFAFARLRGLNEPGPLTYAMLAAVALSLAFLSWRLVELPFRDRRRVSSRQIAGSAVFAGAAVLALGFAGRFSGIADFSTRFDFSPAELAAVAPANGNDAVRDCRWERPIDGFSKIRACRFGAPNAAKTVVLLGDSHAEALFSALDEKFRREGVAGILVRNRYCDLIVGIYEREKAGLQNHQSCVKAHYAVLDYVRRLPASSVVIAARWTFKLYPVSGAIDRLEFDNGEGGVGDERERIHQAFSAGRFVTDGGVKAKAMQDFVTSLLDAALAVFLVYPVPEVGWHVADYNFKHLIAHRPLPSSVSTDYARFASRQRFAIEHLDAIGGNKLVRIHPSDLLCNTYVPGRCAAQVDGRPLYNDDDHLSDLGAGLVADRILLEMRKGGL